MARRRRQRCPDRCARPCPAATLPFCEIHEDFVCQIDPVCGGLWDDGRTEHAAALAHEDHAVGGQRGRAHIGCQEPCLEAIVEEGGEIGIVKEEVERTARTLDDDHPGSIAPGTGPAPDDMGRGGPVRHVRRAGQRRWIGWIAAAWRDHHGQREQREQRERLVSQQTQQRRSPTRPKLCRTPPRQRRRRRPDLNR